MDNSLIDNIFVSLSPTGDVKRHAYAFCIVQTYCVVKNILQTKMQIGHVKYR
jgi:hypothetical protein